MTCGVHGFNFCSSQKWAIFFVMCMRRARGIVQLAVVAIMVNLSINGIGVICRLLFVDVIILDFIILYFMIIYIYIYIDMEFFLTWWSVKCFNYFLLEFNFFSVTISTYLTIINVLQSYEIVQFCNLINYKFTKFTMFTSLHVCNFTYLQVCKIFNQKKLTI